MNPSWLVAQALEGAHVVHYDLKADNVLLEPLQLGAGGEAALWRPQAERPAFRVVLADFGESRMYEAAEDALTLRYDRPFVRLRLPHQ